MPLDELESIWPQYLARLGERSSSAEHWSVDEAGPVQARLDGIAARVDRLRVLWFPMVDSEPVGVEVPAAALLSAALDHFVTAASDLMLATRDAADGICVELNHLAMGDEYEIVVWGALAG